jgi:hypothetical protein
MSQRYTVGVKKKNGAQHPAVMFLYVSTQSGQYLREWTLSPDHGQYRVIEQ